MYVPLRYGLAVEVSYVVSSSVEVSHVRVCQGRQVMLRSVESGFGVFWQASWGGVWRCKVRYGLVLFGRLG